MIADFPETFAKNDMCVMCSKFGTNNYSTVGKLKVSDKFNMNAFSEAQDLPLLMIYVATLLLIWKTQLISWSLKVWGLDHHPYV